MFSFFKRVPAVQALEPAAVPVVSPTGFTGQPFQITTQQSPEDVAWHKSRIPQIEQSIVALKAAGKPTATYEQALALHKLVVEKYSG